MKNKLTRKLMLSAFTLLFAVISLGASTYAWFTMSTEAEVEAFEAQVIGGEGFDIAVTARGGDKTGVTWYNGILPTEAINAIIADDFKFDACTPLNATLTSSETFKTQEEALTKAATASSTVFVISTPSPVLISSASLLYSSVPRSFLITSDQLVASDSMKYIMW